MLVKGETGQQKRIVIADRENIIQNGWWIFMAFWVSNVQEKCIFCTIYNLTVLTDIKVLQDNFYEYEFWADMDPMWSTAHSDS